MKQAALALQWASGPLGPSGISIKHALAVIVEGEGRWAVSPASVPPSCRCASGDGGDSAEHDIHCRIQRGTNSTRFQLHSCLLQRLHGVLKDLQREVDEELPAPSDLIERTWQAGKVAARWRLNIRDVGVCINEGLPLRVGAGFTGDWVVTCCQTDDGEQHVHLNQPFESYRVLVVARAALCTRSVAPPSAR